MLTMTAVGRIGRDVELRRTPGGDSVCNVVIGCNYGKRDDNTTQWVDGALWGARAEGLAEHLTKGKQVILILKDVHIETYEGQNGPGHKLVGNIQELEFGATPQGDGGQRQQQDRGGYDTSARPQQRTQGGGQQRAQGGGYGDRGNSSRGQQQRQQPPAQGKPSSGFDDMDDDIPF